MTVAEPMLQVPDPAQQLSQEQVVLTGQEVALAQRVLQHVRILAGFAGMCADEGGRV